MKLFLLENRRTRVNRLLLLAMSDNCMIKVIQARHILENINRRILQETSLQNSYSNLI